MSDRRHVVADRNRRDHDLAAARRDADRIRERQRDRCPGIMLDVVTREGESVGANEGGYLVIKHPWPSMLRTIWGDDERYKQAYWSEIPGLYFAGDGARRDEHGYFWIMGRVDDVINVSGHRLGTAEIESALVSHEAVAEAAVVGRPDELKGQAISAFVTLEGGRTGSDELKRRACGHTSPKRSAPSPNPTTFDLPTRCRKRARARSCADCCAKLRRAAPSPAMSRRSKTFRFWKNCARTRNRCPTSVPRSPQHDADLTETGRVFYDAAGPAVRAAIFQHPACATKPMRLCITAAGNEKGTLDETNFLEIDDDAEILQGFGRPSDETLLHLTIYRLRPRARCILYSQTVWGMLLSDRYFVDGAIVAAGLRGVKGPQPASRRTNTRSVSRSSKIPGPDRTLARHRERPARKPSDPRASIIRRHGLYAWGETVEEARRHVEIFEFLFDVESRRNA